MDARLVSILRIDDHTGELAEAFIDPTQIESVVAVGLPKDLESRGPVTRITMRSGERHGVPGTPAAVLDALEVRSVNRPA
jgi:hypothetical protein